MKKSKEWSKKKKIEFLYFCKVELEKGERFLCILRKEFLKIKKSGSSIVDFKEDYPKLYQLLEARLKCIIEENNEFTNICFYTNVERYEFIRRLISLENFD